MPRNRNAVAALVAILLLSSPAMAREKGPDVRNALKTWVAAVESGSVDDVTDLYDSHAVLISAFQQKPITTHFGLVKYYHRVESNPGIKIDINEQHPRVYGNFAVNSGIYTLHDTEDGEPMTMPARFSFTYILKDGKWVIIDHHSSRMPGSTCAPQEIKINRHTF